MRTHQAFPELTMIGTGTLSLPKNELNEQCKLVGAVFLKNTNDIDSDQKNDFGRTFL